MALWHHRLDGCEFESAPGDGDWQGGLVCCNSWGHKKSNTTEQLNCTELMDTLSLTMDMSLSKLQELVMDREA